METNKKSGDVGELIAIQFLQKNGYHILDTNFKFGRFGEIDIIGKKDDISIFFEVKYRNSISFGTPEEAITKTKLAKCKKTVEYYCKKKNVDFEKIRFDVITIIKNEDSHRVTHYKNIAI